jgi:hypothetical protein
MNKAAALASAKWFLEDESFPFIVDVCRLRPTEDWHIWRDEAGNVLRLTTNRKLRVYRSTEEESMTSDIYRYAKPQEIARHSYWAMVFVDTLNNTQKLWFLGNDERLRFIRYDSRYKNSLPLLSGTQALKQVAELAGTLDIREKKHIINAAIPWPPEFPLHALLDPILKEIQEKHGW